MLSRNRTGVLHEKQCDPGKNKLMFFGNRKITTFKKLPIDIPKINRVKIITGSIIPGEPRLNLLDPLSGKAWVVFSQHCTLLY